MLVRRSSLIELSQPTSSELDQSNKLCLNWLVKVLNIVDQIGVYVY